MLTADELHLARHRVKNWPIAERRFLTTLTEREAGLILEGVAALDLRPVEALADPDRDMIGKHQRPGDASPTQITAAFGAYPGSGTKRRAVLDAIRGAGRRGMTDEELQIALGMNPSTQRPRRVELVEDGWIKDSQHRRRTKADLPAVVWVLTEAARARPA